jgi:hypothetical protein
MNPSILAIPGKKKREADTIVIVVSAIAMIPPILKLILG